MPGRDRSGPMGGGPISGRGLGHCSGTGAVQFGAGFGTGRGRRRGFGGCFGRGLAVNRPDAKPQRELLEEQREALQNQLEALDEQLENL